MDKKVDKIIEVFGIVLILIVVTMMAVIDLGIISFFGFDYEFIKWIVIFFIMYYILYFPIILVSETLTELISQIKKFSIIQYKIFDFCVGMCVNVALIELVDLVIKGIKIPFATIFIFSILKYIMRQYISNFMNKKFGYSIEEIDEDDD
ncbi:MAG: YrvL family regulatory protein [Clostridia bacterium]